MSIVGEALAIVSCVAGLIQAYDAGSRIVKQIKARRQAHDALPPSDLLEESIEKGKKEIEKVVAEGNQRFGPSFEEGDPTAQIALFKITIATQNALLAGLTQARDDDGVIDFDTCIDTSDKGRVEALIALHALFQRKLEEQMESKKNQSTQAANLPATPAAAATVPGPDKITTHPSATTNTRQEGVTASSPEPVKVKKTRTFTDVVFRRKDSQHHAPASPGPSDDLHQNGRQQTATTQSTPQEMVSRSPRKNARASTSSSATWSSADSRSSISTDITQVQPPPPAPLGRSPSATHSPTSISRQDTSLSTFSTMSTASTLAPITKFGGCCKNAH